MHVLVFVCYPRIFVILLPPLLQSWLFKQILTFKPSFKKQIWDFAQLVKHKSSLKFRTFYLNELDTFDHFLEGNEKELFLFQIFAGLARRLVSRELRLGGERRSRQRPERRQRHHLLPQRGLVNSAQIRFRILT